MLQITEIWKFFSITMCNNSNKRKYTVNKLNLTRIKFQTETFITMKIQNSFFTLGHKIICLPTETCLLCSKSKTSFSTSYDSVFF